MISRFSIRHFVLFLVPLSPFAPRKGKTNGLSSEKVEFTRAPFAEQKATLEQHVDIDGDIAEHHSIFGVNVTLPTPSNSN